MNIIDAHVHFEPDISSLDDMITAMDREGIERAALIPRLTIPAETKKADFPLAVQRAMFFNPVLRPLGIAITKSMYRESGKWNMWFRRGNKEPRQFEIITHPENDLIAQAIASYPERLLGWIFINPMSDGALDELEKWKDVPQMVGVKIHPFWHKFPMEKIMDVAARTSELGKPLLVHLGFGESGNFRWLIDNFPELKIIFAHLGIPFYKDIWREARGRENIFFDVASTYHVDQRLIQKAVKKLGAEKIIFGSDSPYAHDNAARMIMDWIDALPLPDRDKAAIYSGNFLRVTGLDTRKEQV